MQLHNVPQLASVRQCPDWWLWKKNRVHKNTCTCTMNTVVSRASTHDGVLTSSYFKGGGKNHIKTKIDVRRGVGRPLFTLLILAKILP